MISFRFLKKITMAGFSGDHGSSMLNKKTHLNCKININDSDRTGYSKTTLFSNDILNIEMMGKKKVKESLG